MRGSCPVYVPCDAKQPVVARATWVEINPITHVVFVIEMDWLWRTGSHNRKSRTYPFVQAGDFPGSHSTHSSQLSTSEAKEPGLRFRPQGPGTGQWWCLQKCTCAKRPLWSVDCRLYGYTWSVAIMLTIRWHNSSRLFALSLHGRRFHFYLGKVTWA